MIILNAMDGNNEESNNVMVSEFDKILTHILKNMSLHSNSMLIHNSSYK
jgi:hypothetical protein